MSKHWNPDEDLARIRGPRPKAEWPEGATVGLVVLAGACIGFAALLYRIAGPTDLFAP